MLITKTARDARDNFTDLLGTVYYGNQSVAIDKNGRTFAVVVNPGEYKALKNAAKSRFFEDIKDIQSTNQGVDPEVVLQDVTAETELVRAQNYVKNKQPQGGD